jgi:hypothetical protein
MKIEYLIKSKEHLDYISELKLDKVQTNLSKVPDKEVRIYSVLVKGETMDNAKLLSNVNKNILQAHKLTTLSNGSSEYFVKALFSSAHEFEVKLRRILHLASSFDDSVELTEGRKYIENLELETLGEIFTFIFTDNTFNDMIRNVFNEKIAKIYKLTQISKNINKSQYINYISDLKEKTVWSDLMGDRVPALNTNFFEIISARNDIAHAHNIDFEKYETNRKLFSKVIGQLDDAISSFENHEEAYKNFSNFNSRMSVALHRYKRQNAQQEIDGLIVENMMIKMLSRYNHNASLISKTIDNLNKVSSEEESSEVENDTEDSENITDVFE